MHTETIIHQADYRLEELIDILQRLESMGYGPDSLVTLGNGQYLTVENRKG